MKYLRQLSVLLISLPGISQTTITIQPDGQNGNDAMIWAAPNYGNDNVNYGSTDQLVLNAWTNSSVNDTIRVLLEFDLSNVPVGAVISNAKLSLYNNPDGASHNGQHQNLAGTNEWSINRITEAWDESVVTWNTKPTYTTTNQIIMNASTSPNQDFTDINVTALVQDMIDNPSTGFGFYLKLQDESPYKALVFASSEHSDLNKRPRLEITYSIADIDELSWHKDREVVKIVDQLGRETSFAPNVPLIYVFSDGTRERRSVIQ